MRGIAGAGASTDTNSNPLFPRNPLFPFLKRRVGGILTKAGESKFLAVAEIDEQTNLAEANPEVVKELLALAEKVRADIGDHDRMGAGARFFDDAPKRPDIKRPKK